MATKHKKTSRFYLSLLFARTLIALVFGVYFIFFHNPTVSYGESNAGSLLNFPADHGPHPNFAAEWYYVNLLARTAKADGTDQKDMSWVISFSRINGSYGLLSSNYDNALKTFKESTDTGGSLVARLIENNSLLYVGYNNGLVGATLQELAPATDRKRSYILQGRTANVGSINFTLKERTVITSGFNTPLLWGGTGSDCQGRISVFAPGDTYYYSIPDLDITGTFRDMDGTNRKILVGKAWIDHQWFNNTPPSDWRGHYWTNFHLTTSGNIYDPGPHQAIGFVTQIYTNGPRYTYWVKRNADGANECGISGTLDVNNYGMSGYPSSLKLILNKNSTQFLQTNGVAFSDNQIFQPLASKKFVETASYYTGSIDGKSFTGLGFFETHLTQSNSYLTPTIIPEVSSTTNLAAASSASASSIIDCTVDPLSTPYCALLELRNLIGVTVDVMIVIAFLSSIAFIIIGGFKYIMSGGDPKAMDNARHTITYAVVGLIVAVAAYGILRALKTYLGNVPGIQ